MRKILFLDIDGVIAIPETHYELSDDKQKLLGEIIDRTNCEIVISSSWRKHELDLTKEYFNRKGFNYTHLITGITIRAYHYIDKKEKIHLSIPRGVEIKQWLDTNIHSDNGKDYERKKPGKDFTYCIVDDDVDMLLEHKNYFVNVDENMGLTKRNVNKIVDILNNNLI